MTHVPWASVTVFHATMFTPRSRQNTTQMPLPSSALFPDGSRLHRILGHVFFGDERLDKRARLVIAICLFLNFEHTGDRFPKALAKSMKDRESQIMGNEPFYLPVLTAKGEDPGGMGIGADEE